MLINVNKTRKESPRKEQSKKYYQKNKEKVKNRAREYRKNLTEEKKEEQRNKSNIRHKERYWENVEYERVRKRTILGKLQTMYASMKFRSKEERFKNVKIITKENFIQFGLKNDRYIILFNNWVESGYDNKLSPTIDRVNNKLGYIEGNLQFLTKSENCKKRFHEDGCFNNGKSVKTKIINCENENILYFNSRKEVAEFLKSAYSNIRRAIRKKYKVKGYWILDDE